MNIKVLGTYSTIDDNRSVWVVSKDESGLVWAGRVAWVVEDNDGNRRTVLAEQLQVDYPALVAAVRKDKLVGRGTCSVIDECWSDMKLVDELKHAGVKTTRSARSWARKLEKLHSDYAADIQAEAF